MFIPVLLSLNRLAILEQVAQASLLVSLVVAH